MTELSPCATFLPWQRSHRRGPRQGPAPLGRPPDLLVDVRVVDADDQPVPRGTVGEIVARGET